MRRRVDMKRLALAAALAAALFPGCGAAADNEITVAKVKPSVVTIEPTLPAACRDFQDFLLSDCELSWYGVRFYGTIDVGYGYQTHGAPWDPNYVSGSSYFLLKMNRSRMWTLAPNGSSCPILAFKY